MIYLRSENVTDKGGSMHQFSPQMSSEARTDVAGKLSVPSVARGTNWGVSSVARGTNLKLKILSTMEGNHKWG